MTKSSNEGHNLGHIWSKSAVRQSPPMRGTFWTTFGPSPLRDKVLQQGAQFGPHLVKVYCMTKSSNEGHILGHIWLKSAACQSPSMRGTFWTTFGQSVCCVTKSSNEGHNLDHIWSKSTVRQSPPTRGNIVFATFGHCPLHDNFVR